jgi:RimJ/RimL family protein N-acetyltransferase
LYRRFYKEVGERWYWHDRLEWSDERLAAHLSSPNVGVWVVEEGDELVGFYELQRQGDDRVEIAYFGLTPTYIGRGIGGFMLTRAVEDAWRMGAKRVWLHTCTLDSDRALPNYLARGFVPFKTERLEVDIEGTRVVGERVLLD